MEILSRHRFPNLEVDDKTLRDVAYFFFYSVSKDGILHERRTEVTLRGAEFHACKHWRQCTCGRTIKKERNCVEQCCTIKY